MNQAAVQTETRQSLTAEAWANAALEAIAQGGLDAVAVEPLARKLKVTKGSFYWHFTNRGELIRAALALWEKSETVDILARIEPGLDPYERIVNVFKQANASYRAGRLYLAIASGEDHPVISEYVRRVSESRMTYLRDCYRDLGFSENRARHWARFAYATFMGNLQIRRDTPDAMPQGDEFNEYLRLMITTLIPREVVDDSAMCSAATRRLPAGQRVRERPKADAASTQKQQVIEAPAVSDAQRVADESESASRVVQMRRNAKP